MDLIRIFQRFPDNEACIDHLERVRWGDTPRCPHCQSERIGRKADGERVGRWNCHKCHASFSVLSGTIFHKTRVPLPKWFLAISLMLNAKKSLSSHQLGRDLDLNQKTAWRLAMQIRSGMVDDGELMSGIIEADEAYVGGKPRKRNKRNDNEPKAPRGRGTSKLPIIGVMERGGKVAAEPSPRVTGANLAAFIGRHVDRDASLLMTDQWPAYRRIGRTMRHATVDHAARYVDGLIHINGIEGFWALVKRAWFGSHHHYSRRHAAAYITESCYKYNARKLDNAFGIFVRDAVATA